MTELINFIYYLAFNVSCESFINCCNKSFTNYHKYVSVYLTKKKKNSYKNKCVFSSHKGCHVSETRITFYNTWHKQCHQKRKLRINNFSPLSFITHFIFHHKKLSDIMLRNARSWRMVSSWRQLSQQIWQID